MNLCRRCEPPLSFMYLPINPVWSPMRQKSGRDRLDRTLVLRALAQSREQADQLILSGKVQVDGMPVDKPARLVSSDTRIEILGEGELALPAYINMVGMGVDFCFACNWFVIATRRRFPPLLFS